MKKLKTIYSNILYINLKHTKDKSLYAITIHSKTTLDAVRLSVEPLSKEMINQQIFYKN